jgi:zeta-carotene desaturase
VKDLRVASGLDNLLYSADVFFSCFADLALVSPEEYYKEGQGSLMQCVITPAAPYMPWTNEAIAKETDRQVWWGWGWGWGKGVPCINMSSPAPA